MTRVKAEDPDTGQEEQQEVTVGLCLPQTPGMMIWIPALRLSSPHQPCVAKADCPIGFNVKPIVRFALSHKLFCAIVIIILSEKEKEKEMRRPREVTELD